MKFHIGDIFKKGTFKKMFLSDITDIFKLLTVLYAFAEILAGRINEAIIIIAVVILNYLVLYLLDIKIEKGNLRDVDFIEGKDIELTAKQINMLFLISGIIGGAALGVATYIKTGNIINSILNTIGFSIGIMPNIYTMVITFMRVGAVKMAQNGINVKSLDAVEDLVHTKFICTDYKEILTDDNMILKALCTADSEIQTGKAGQSDKNFQMLKMAYIFAVTAFDKNGLIEREIEGNAKSLGIFKEDLQKKYPLVKSFGGGVVVSIKNGYRTICIGNPQQILNMSDFAATAGGMEDMTQKLYNCIHGKNIQLEKMGYELMAVAFKDTENIPEYDEELRNGFVYTGTFCLDNPVRGHISKLVNESKRALVRTVIVSDESQKNIDYVADATGCEFEDSRADRADTVRKFHRLKVGVLAVCCNRQEEIEYADADVRISFDQESDCEVVLDKKNYGLVANAVKMARIAYENIRRAIHFTASVCVAEAVAFIGSMLFSCSMPFNIMQLIWVNFLIFVPLMCLSFGTQQDRFLKSHNDFRIKGIMHEKLWIRDIFQGLIIGLLVMTAFVVGHYYIRPNGISDEQAIKTGKTMAVAVMCFASIAHLYSIKSNLVLLKSGITENKLLNFASIISICLQIAVMCIPAVNSFFEFAMLGADEWIWVAVLSLAQLVLIQILKSGKSVKKNKKRKKR